MISCLHPPPHHRSALRPLAQSGTDGVGDGVPWRIARCLEGLGAESHDDGNMIDGGQKAGHMTELENRLAKIEAENSRLKATLSATDAELAATRLKLTERDEEVSTLQVLVKSYCKQPSKSSQGEEPVARKRTAEGSLDEATPETESEVPIPSLQTETNRGAKLADRAGTNVDRTDDAAPQAVMERSPRKRAESGNEGQEVVLWKGGRDAHEEDAPGMGRDASLVEDSLGRQRGSRGDVGLSPQLCQVPIKTDSRMSESLNEGSSFSRVDVLRGRGTLLSGELGGEGRFCVALRKVLVTALGARVLSSANLSMDVGRCGVCNTCYAKQPRTTVASMGLMIARMPMRLLLMGARKRRLFVSWSSVPVPPVERFSALASFTMSGGRLR